MRRINLSPIGKTCFELSKLRYEREKHQQMKLLESLEIKLHQLPSFLRSKLQNPEKYFIGIDPSGKNTDKSVSLLLVGRGEVNNEIILEYIKKNHKPATVIIADEKFKK